MTEEAHLTLEPAAGADAVLDLSGVAPISIGRGSDMDLPIDDPTISHLHAQLTPVCGEWLLVDGGLSRNGSFVNGVRVEHRRRLRDGDRITLGRTELHFHTRRGSQQPGPRMRPEALPARHRELLAALARPLRENGGLPATNTEIARSLGAPVADIRAALTELRAWFGLRTTCEAETRRRLAEIAGGSPEVCA